MLAITSRNFRIVQLEVREPIVTVLHFYASGGRHLRSLRQNQNRASLAQIQKSEAAIEGRQRFLSNPLQPYPSNVVSQSAYTFAVSTRSRTLTRSSTPW